MQKSHFGQFSAAVAIAKLLRCTADPKVDHVINSCKGPNLAGVLVSFFYPKKKEKTNKQKTQTDKKPLIAG